MVDEYPGSERHFEFNGSTLELEEVTHISVLTDNKSITVVVDSTGDEANGEDIVAALRSLADTLENKVAALRFATGQ